MSKKDKTLEIPAGKCDTVPVEQKKSPTVPTKLQLIEACWVKGNFKYKLKTHQLPIYDAIRKAFATPNSSVVINCSRQKGKTYTALIVASEECIRHPNTQYRYAIPVSAKFKDMCLLSLNNMYADSPCVKKEVDGKIVDTFPYKPQVLSDKRVVFPNGSEIVIAGTNEGNNQNLRGSASSGNFLDEAGFQDDLEVTVKEILAPQLLTTDGPTVFISSPANTPDHYYNQVVQEHIESGDIVTLDIHTDKTLTKQKLDAMARSVGGYESAQWKREFLCMNVYDRATKVFRTWDPHFVMQEPENTYSRMYFKYECMDLGYRDKMACLFGYYHYHKAKLHIQSEIVMTGDEFNSKTLSELVFAKEKELWMSTRTDTILRFADNNNPTTLQDLRQIYDLHFEPTSKDDLAGMVNTVETFIQEGHLSVDPSCTELIGCLENAHWAKDQRGKMFAHSKKYGHYDAGAALIYMVRNIDTITNPIPDNMGMNFWQHNVRESPVQGLNSSDQALVGAMFPNRFG